MEPRRVVITGIGLVTSIGLTRQSTWEAMLAGRSGVAPIASFPTEGYRTRFGAEARDFDPLVAMDAKAARKADRFCQMALVAAAEAMAQAQPGEADPFRVGCIIGSGIGGMLTFEDQHATLVQRGPSRVSPMFIPMLISDMAAGLVSIQYGCRGPNWCTTSACASAGHAIASALDMIRLGRADVMITGGSEASVCPSALAGFGAMKALSARNDDPARASRPFDAERDGFVLGEGAGVLVLEEAGRARARGATIVAELAGYGATADAFHMTQPDEDGAGARAAMQFALQDAGIAPEQVGYINAHGTSTHYNDKIETKAIRELFGAHAERLAVSSCKSMIGHLLGAAGAVEAAATALALQQGVLPPTINYERPDPECDLDYVPNQARPAAIEAALSNSFGFGGHNVSLCFRPWR